MTEQQNGPRTGQVVTFYSYKGGTGRTMALANTAWILAANGKRVLVVDWDLEAPGLDRFLHPFLPVEAMRTRTGVINMITTYRETLRQQEAWPPDHLDNLVRQCTSVGPHVIELNWSHFPGEGSLSYLSAGQVDWNYSEALSSLDWTAFYEKEHGHKFLTALRNHMAANYDYALIDSRTGLSDAAGICTMALPDSLVICFTLSDQSIEGASYVARSVGSNEHRRRLRVLPVPMRIDEGEHEKAEAGKALARKKFDGLPEGRSGSALNDYWSAVPFPYQPFYAYEEMLACFGDAPGEPRSLLSACERLTKEITEGEIVSLPPMEEDLRLTYKARYTRGRSTVLLAHLPQDDAWARWIREVLETADYQVAMQELGERPEPEDTAVAAEGQPESEESRLESASRVVSVVSRAFQNSAEAQRFQQRMAEHVPPADTPWALSVVVGNARQETVRPSERVDLTPFDEESAIKALLRALDARRSVPEGIRERIDARYPGGEPTIWNVPVRNRTFTGRAEELERLRLQLRGGSAAALLPVQGSDAVPQALYGLGGVGKTQLAKEYAYRYRYEYDLVWWVPADQRDLVPVELANLAQRIEAYRPSGEGTGTGNASVSAPTAAAAVDALRRGYPSKHWLLIFDNAGETEDVVDFLPGGSGHVIITSRNPAWVGHAEPLNLDVFQREESVRHLRSRVSTLTEAEAGEVAEKLGDLPLAIEQGAAWLNTTGTPVPEYLDMLSRELTPVLEAGKATDYPTAVAATWTISMETLRAAAPAAARVLELCAFFGADPISMDLLYDRELRRELSDLDPKIVDRASFGTVFEQMGKYSLARIDNAHGTVQLHRLVQAVVRSRLDEEAREQRRRRVHQLLTSGRTRIEAEVDAARHWPELERIWPHLGPSDAQLSAEPETRELMVDWVRYLWLRSEYDAAHDVAEQLDVIWTREFGDDDWLTLRLRRELGNILRSQGLYREALELDESTLDRSRRVRGNDHVHTLITAGNVGADLRALGRYREALEQDLATLQVMTRELGPEDIRTLRMANNVALDHRLLGDYQRALDLDQATWQNRERVLRPDAPETLLSESNLVRDLRDTGRLQEAVTRLQRIKERMERVQGPDHIQSLVMARNLAVSQRLAGQVSEARQLTADTVRRFRERYGPDNPDTRMCELNLAADLWVNGDHQQAVDLARDVHKYFDGQLGSEHPNTLGSADNLAVYLSTESLDRDQRLEALKLSETTCERLEAQLGLMHPFAVCSAVNRANILAGHERYDEAETVGRNALRRAEEGYGERSLDRAVCAANLALTLAELGRSQESEKLREESLQILKSLLGGGHPEYQRARAGKRVSRILELQPW